MQTDLTPELETGIEEIDAQHRDLLRKVNDLFQASRALKAEEEMARLLWFLKRYVRKHFRDEERLQLESGFPGYSQHKAEHEWFYAEVRNLEKRYSKGGAGTTLIVSAIMMMGNWLRNHFLVMDKVLAEHLRQVEASHRQ